MLSYAQQRAAERERKRITKALRKYVKRNCRSKRDLAKTIERGASPR